MGQAPPGDSYNAEGCGLPLIAGAGDFDGNRPAAKKFTTAPAKTCAPGDIVLGIRASIGAKVVADKEYCLGRGVAGLRAKEELNQRYLWHWLTRATPNLAAKGKGATFLQVTREDIAAMTVEVPPIEEQRRVAAILDKADAFRALRREATEKLDELTSAIFLDVFGDPVANPLGWSRVPLGDVVTDISSGTSPVCESRPAQRDEWGVLKLGAVTYGVFEPTEQKAFLGDVTGMRANEVRPGDLLMTRKNTRDLVGAVAVVPDVRPHLLLPDLIFRLIVDETRVSKTYLHALLMDPRKRPQVRALASGSAGSMPNISQARLRALILELPPIDLQHRFEQMMGVVRGQRARGYAYEELSCELQQALRSSAFAGAA